MNELLRKALFQTILELPSSNQDDQNNLREKVIKDMKKKFEAAEKEKIKA